MHGWIQSGVGLEVCLATVDSEKCLDLYVFKWHAKNFLTQVYSSLWNKTSQLLWVIKTTAASKISRFTYENIDDDTNSSL